MIYSDKGFSLIELLVGLLISMIMIVLAGNILVSTLNQVKFQAEHATRNKEIKGISYSMSRDILNAGNGLFLNNKNICTYGMVAINGANASVLINPYPVVMTPDPNTLGLGTLSDQIQITSFYVNDLQPPYRSLADVDTLGQDIKINKTDFINIGDKLLIGNINQKVPCIIVTVTSIDPVTRLISYTYPSVAGISGFTFTYKEDSFIYNLSAGSSTKKALQSWIYFIDPTSKELKYYDQLSTTSNNAHTALSNVYAFWGFYNQDIAFHAYNGPEGSWYRQGTGPISFNIIPPNTPANMMSPYIRNKVKGFKFFMLKKGDKKNTNCDLTQQFIPLLQTKDRGGTQINFDLSQLGTDWKCWYYSVLQAENPIINGVMNE